MTDRPPDRPPFTLRARIISPLDDGRTLDLADGLIEVDAGGTIIRVRAFDAGAPAPAPGHPVIDLRPLVVLPGLVDLHAHLPQLPNAGLGYGLDLLTWLERHIFPLEREWQDPAVAERVAPLAFRSMAAAGTTTVLAYGAVYEASIDAAFAAAATHGIRATIGKVMMDRITYDERHEPGSTELTSLSLAQSAELCARWHGHDGGRLRYAFTPRFAVSCTPALLRESAEMARTAGATWQTHLSEDVGEIDAVAALFPGARHYLDVYDQAGALRPGAVFAHAVHLSDDELGRLVETGAAVAHCPSSNLFLASGMMPLARYLAAGLAVGLGTDVAAGPDLSIWSVMAVGAYTQHARRAAGDPAPLAGPLDWLRLATLGGARALGLGGVIGSIEAGREADLIALDVERTAPTPASAELSTPDVVSRLMFRHVPGVVRGAWVRGRRLAGTDGDA